jgi:putative hydrolase of the HAD superfamily
MVIAVLFDLDGLLADTETLHCRTYRETLANHGISLSESEYAEHWIRGGKGIADWLAQRGLDLDPAILRREKAARFLEALASLQPLPGAVEALERMREQKRIALATASWTADVDAVDARLDIVRYFDQVVTGSEVSRMKPAPDLFLRAAERLGVAPSSCVVVEDAEKGVIAARRAGMAAIAIPNRFTRDNDFSGASRVLSSLEELTIELVDSVGDGPAAERFDSGEGPGEK